MKRIAAFLIALTTLFSSFAVYAEEASVAPKKPPVQALLEQSLASTEKNGILLIGGSASYAWSKTFAFDMYPHVCASLAVDGSLAHDWTPYVQMLVAYQPKAVVMCLDGRDDPVEANSFARLLTAYLPNAKVYVVSAAWGENAAEVNRTAMAVSDAEFVDVYSGVLTPEGTVDTELVGEMGFTEKGIRKLGEVVASAVGRDFTAVYPQGPEYVPPVLEPDASDEQGSSYRWLVPIAILAAGLIIGVDCARTAAVNDRRRRAQAEK